MGQQLVETLDLVTSQVAGLGLVAFLSRRQSGKK